MTFIDGSDVEVNTNLVVLQAMRGEQVLDCGSTRTGRARTMLSLEEHCGAYRRFWGHRTSHGPSTLAKLGSVRYVRLVVWPTMV